MIRTTCLCDRCGEEVVSGRTLLRIEASSSLAPLPGWPLDASGKPAVDLRPECLGALLNWLGERRM